MINITTQLLQIAERQKQRENPIELKSDLLQIIAQLNNLLDVESTLPVSIGKLTSDRLKELTDLTNIDHQFLKTGFVEFDEIFGGIMKGELMVVGGRPGMGKTTFMINLCTNMASIGKPVAYISLELSNFQVANRFISHSSKISLHELTKGFPTPKQLVEIKAAVDRFNDLPLFVYDQYNSSVFEIIERIRYLKDHHKVELVMIDYLQMVTASRNKYREAELAFISREFKKLAKELNIAIVASSQLSRQVENRPGGSKRPQLSDLRESGAIEQDADKVLFLYRPEYYGIEFDENNEPTKRLLELIMAKNKSGNLETIRLKCEKYFTGFTDYGDILISNERLNDLD